MDAAQNADTEGEGVPRMRKMQQLTPEQGSIKMTSIFRGYNHNEVINDGEMYDMQNLSGDRYPVLSLRKKRGIYEFPQTRSISDTTLTGIHGRDQLVFIRGTDVYYNFTKINDLAVSINEAMLPKQIISYGAYVLIFPDKVYFNTADLSDKGSMERLWPGSESSITGANVTAVMCREDGTDYDNTEITVSDTAPEDPENGAFWCDTSGINDVLKQWDEYTAEWVEVATTFVKLGATGIGSGLSAYDAIEISGLEAASGSTEKIQAEIDDLNGTKIIYACGADYIVVTGLLNTSQAALADVAISADRKIPDLDFICESNNRLWGCKYGLVNGAVVNEIRACKLGDFRNWNCYLGISTDSYTASVGTDGAFTGACTQRGYPVFFKENCIHRVSGQTPGTFTIQTTIGRGVQRDCWRSLAVVAENIYYKARTGVMVYDGNMPEPISNALGDILYSDARAGVLGDKYYISMKDGSDNWRLFVYDTKTGCWWKEDSVKALAFGTVDDELFFIDETENALVSVTGSVGEPENDFAWAAEFSMEGTTYMAGGDTDSPRRVRNSKYMSMFKIRAYLAPGAFMRLWIKYDEEPMYKLIGERRGHDMRTFILPVIPQRCDHLRFKITGQGDAKIYDISRIMEVGGDG